MNAMNKKTFMPLIVLSAICLVIAAVLGAVNMITAPEIEAKRKEIVAKSLVSVMPNGDFTELSRTEYVDEAPKTVNNVYIDNVSGGHVVTLSKQGYASVIDLTVGIDANKKITKVVITSESESHGKDGITTTFVDSFAGTDASASQKVDHISGATKTSEYIKSAVYDAFVVLGYAAPKNDEVKELPAPSYTLTKDDVIAKAKKLQDGEYKAVETEGLPNTVIGVYKRTEGGYAIHIASRSEYIPLDTEGVVTVDRFGTINGIEMVHWLAGYDPGNTPIPPLTTEELLSSDEGRAFIDSFVGKNAYTLTRVDIVTNATLNSNRFADALTAALEALYPARVWTGTVVALFVAAALGAVGVLIYIKRRKTA